MREREEMGEGERTFKEYYTQRSWPGLCYCWHEYCSLVGWRKGGARKERVGGEKRRTNSRGKEKELKILTIKGYKETEEDKNGKDNGKMAK